MADETMKREDEFTCQHCGEEFTSREELEEHRRELHPEESRGGTAGRSGTGTAYGSGGRSGTTTGPTGGRTGQQQPGGRSASPRREPH